MKSPKNLSGGKRAASSKGEQVSLHFPASDASSGRPIRPAQDTNESVGLELLRFAVFDKRNHELIALFFDEETMRNFMLSLLPKRESYYKKL